MIFVGNITIDRTQTMICHGDVARIWRHWDTREAHSFKIMEHLILSGGVTATKLLDLLYDDDPNGGPALGIKQIHVMICNLQPAIAMLGLTLKKHRQNSHIIYRISQPQNVVRQAA